MPKKGGPPPKSLKKKVKFEESKSSGKVAMTGGVVPAGGCESDSKTCRGCLKKGHIWANCLDRVTTEKVLVGQDKDDWQSDDEDD